MALGSGRKIVVEFIGDASSLRANAKSGEAALQGFSGKAQAAGKIAGKALAGGLLLAGAAAISATKAAAEDEAAQAQLAQQLKQAAGASDKQIASVEDWISKASLATGVADDELRPAFAKLATATGDVHKAQDLMTQAMDIAAGSGQSLESVTKTLAKAQTTGSVAAYAKLGGATKDAAGNTLSLADATQALADKYKGSAAKAAETTAGKTKIMQVQFGELQEQIGAKLLPVMTKLASAGLKVVDWVSKNTTTVGIFLAALGSLLAVVTLVGAATKVASAVQAVWSAATALSAAVTTAMNSTFVLRLQLLALDAAAWVKSTAAMVANKVAVVASTVATTALSVATKVMAAGQWLLNAAMSANPIGLVVIAVVALIAGLVLAYKKSETFRTIVNAAFHGVAKVVGFVVDFVKDHWRLMISLMLGPFGVAIALITKHWDKIKYGAQIVIGWVQSHWPALKAMVVAPFEAAKTLIGNIWSDIKAGFGAVREKLSHDLSTIKGAFSTAFGVVKSVIQGAIDKVEWLLNKLGDLYDKLTHIPHPHIPGLGRTGSGGVAGALIGGTKEEIAEGRSMLDKASDASKKHLEKLKKQLAAVVELFKGVRDSVSQAFAGDLFSASATDAVRDAEGNIVEAAASAGQNFIKSLQAKKGQLGQLSAAFKTLLGWGWSPQALTSLFQSGNAGVILDLAANRDLAQQGANLYGDVTSAADALGAQVGTSMYGAEIDRLTGQINAGGGKGGNGGLDRTVNVNVNMGLVTDPVAAAREVVKAVRQLERSTGRQLLATGG